MNVLIACGGTGGHLFPGMAVAETLLSRGHAVRLLVSAKAVDSTALAALTSGCDPSAGGPGNPKLSVKPLCAIGFSGSRQLMRFCSRLAQATHDCMRDRANFAPDAVLGMGGFTSAPAVLAARWRGTRTLIHESNAVPGKANCWVGKLADQVAVGLADCARFFPRKSVTVTGTPIRAALRRGRVANAHAQLGLRADRLTVLVAGGSQGAHAVNEAIACALPWLDEWTDRAQFVHLTGKDDEAFVREAYEKNGFAAKVVAFCHQMELAYTAADVVISRAGAATLTEIAAFALPAILIPFPHAAGDHQTHNARVFERAGAARLIEQKHLSGLHAATGERLGEALGALLGDGAARRQMAAAAQQLSITDAHERIADLVAC